MDAMNSKIKKLLLHLKGEKRPPYVELTEEDHEAFLRKLKKRYPDRYNALSEEEIEKVKAIRARTGVAAVEYDAFDFWDKTKEEIDGYVTLNMAKNTFYRTAKELENRAVLRNKFKSYEKLKEFYKRDIVVPNDRKAFVQFCKTHDSFIAKDPGGSGGKGIQFVDLKETGLTPKEYFNENLKNKNIVVEEIVVQRPELAQFHPASINTVRPVTYCKKGKVTFLFCIMRIGRGGSKVDNLSSGGICVKVDPDTGRIISGAINRTSTVQMETHPDTGVTFVGSQLPDWEEFRDTVTKAALHLQDPPFVGWDMAYTTKGWMIIEANWNPTLREAQMLTGHGLRKELKDATHVDFHL